MLNKNVNERMGGCTQLLVLFQALKTNSGLIFEQDGIHVNIFQCGTRELYLIDSWTVLGIAEGTQLNKIELTVLVQPLVPTIPEFLVKTIFF